MNQVQMKNTHLHPINELGKAVHFYFVDDHDDDF